MPTAIGLQLGQKYQLYSCTIAMGCFAVVLKPLGSLSTILITRLLLTKIITGQDTDSKYFSAHHCYLTGKMYMKNNCLTADHA